MTPLAHWAVNNYTPEVRNVGLKIQIMESYVDAAAQNLRKLLDTLDGFGQPKFREY
jgi:hypothetical protein